MVNQVQVTERSIKTGIKSSDFDIYMGLKVSKPDHELKMEISRVRQQIEAEE